MSLGWAARAVWPCRVFSSSDQGLWALSFPFLRFPPMLGTCPCRGWSQGAEHPAEKSASVHPVIPSFPGSTQDMITHLLQFNSQNKFPFIFWCLCIHQRGKGVWAGQSRHKGAQVKKEAAIFLECSISFIHMHFLPVPASQGLFWQVWFCKLGFILFLLRKSQAKRSPTRIFWTAASPTASALKMILQIFSAVLYTKKKILTLEIFET